MGVGVEIYGEAGNLQASTDRFTLGLASHGAVTLTDYGGTHPQPRVAANITLTGTNPVLFILPSSKTVFLERSYPSGSSFIYRLVATSSTPVTVQYWVFDVPAMAYKDPAMSNMGLQVFDNTLTPTFDAAMDAMHVKGLVEVYPAPDQTGNVYYPSGSLTDMRTISVPSGRRYAVAFSGLSNTQAMQDTGQYAMGAGYPSGVETRPDEEGNTPPPGGAFNWRRMRLETLYSGIQQQGGFLSVGISPIEFFEGWYPMGRPNTCRVLASVDFIIADVTDIASTGLPTTPGQPVINASAAERRIEVMGTQTTITPEVTITISGGTAPYSILWQLVSGSGTPVPFAGVTSTTFRTQITNQTAGTGFDAIWRARVTDAVGAVGYSQDVNFVHIAKLPDYTPDALTLVPINYTINENMGVVGDTCDLKGFDQSITLRFSHYGFTGVMDSLLVDVYRGPQGTFGPWTHVGGYDPRVPGSYVEAVYDNTHQIYYVIRATSVSGRKQANFNLTVTNLSDASTVIASNAMQIVMDNDNNYNPATGMTPVDWPDWSVYSSNTNGGSFLPNYSDGPSRTIAGLVSGQTSTLTLTASNIFGDALLAVGFIKNGAYQGEAITSNRYATTASSNYGNGITVQNGDTIAMRVIVLGQSADQWTTYTEESKTMNVSVTASVGGFIDVFNASGTYSDQFQTGGGGLDPVDPF